MEEQFLELMSETESQAFVIYTKGLKELAQYYRCEREVGRQTLKKGKNLNKKKVTEITTKLIFGVGHQDKTKSSESCRIVPASVGGFLHLRLNEKKVKDIPDVGDDDSNEDKSE